MNASLGEILGKITDEETKQALVAKMNVSDWRELLGMTNSNPEVVINALREMGGGRNSKRGINND